MRGDDQPSRYPPRGVWFGLFLSALLLPAAMATAQDPTGTNPGAPADPLRLAADRITRWSDPEARYLFLTGSASAFQGTEGLRATQILCRIVDINGAEGTTHEVEVYAEGNVRPTSSSDEPQPAGRFRFRTPEIAMTAYAGSGGYRSLPSPPRGFAMLDRSGLGRTQTAPPQSRQARTSVAMQDGPDPTPPPPTIVPAASRPRSSVPRSARPKLDPMVITAQATTNGPPTPEDDPPPIGPNGEETVPELMPSGRVRPPSSAEPPANAPGVDLPPIEEQAPGVDVPALPSDETASPPSIEPLPEGRQKPNDPNAAPGPATEPEILLPIAPGSKRVTYIEPRGGQEMDIKALPTAPDGTQVVIYRNGVRIHSVVPGSGGEIDMEADQAIIWRGPSPQDSQPQTGPNGEIIEDGKKPFEVYLEGNVIVRQDQRKYAGRADQRTIRAPRVYFNLLTDRAVAVDAEIDLWAQGLVAPFKIKSPRIEQFHELIKQPDGTLKADPTPKIRIDKANLTGSLFPDPGYHIFINSLELSQYANPSTDPITGKHLYNPGDPNPPQDLRWRMDARQNFYYMGGIPAFFWPRVAADVDEEQRAFRQFFFRTNNYFGQQLLTDWNGFRFIGVKKPDWIDVWNIDVDYLSARTKTFPALGSEIGWFGNDLIKDLRDPYHKTRKASNITNSYYGYFTIWGLQDYGTDVLGQGPAIVTNGPPGAGKAGIQMYSTPAYKLDRFRLDFRHMQSFLDEDPNGDHPYEALRLQTEAAYYTDRYFLFEYYQMLWDTGMDQETLTFGYYQKNNTFTDIEVSGNPMNWVTQTEWLPKVDYYRISDSFLNNHVVYYQHSGLDYATITTDIMVNNPNLFAYMPYDPISNTSGTFSSGRYWTSHEIDLPMNFFNAFRLVPYVQGQLAAWNNQLGGGPMLQQTSGPMGRAWGAVGTRAEATFYKRYRGVHSEILNIHGLNNKISFFLDARAAFSNVSLNSVAVQDTLDDNTYEFIRRYFAMTNFVGGILPYPYDPRFYILRNMISPITGTTDIQASIDTVQLGVHQRLQTKRGPIGNRRIVDFMTLDATTTYYPDARRDNYGTPWGLAQYNYQWYIGDRTSLVSQGWFDFFNLVGSQPLVNNLTTGYNPNGINVITSGINLMRPPRSNINILYTIIDTGPIKTSALNTSFNYWLSPKWYATFANSYDFGDGVDLGTMFTFTRIGADYLTTLGLSVDPQRQSYQFAVQITPRMSPAFRMGSNAAMNTFDTRFAPSQ